MIKVAINGYGTIGKRVADAVNCQKDMEVVGVTKKYEKFRVFVSHEATTGYSYAKHLKKAFKKIGIEAFVAEDDIDCGDVWKNIIDFLIKNVDYFVLIITTLTPYSKEVMREIEKALTQPHLKIIPCIYEKVSKKVIREKIPHIYKLQWIKFREKEELANKVISKLVSTPKLQ